MSVMNGTWLSLRLFARQGYGEFWEDYLACDRRRRWVGLAFSEICSEPAKGLSQITT